MNKLSLIPYTHNGHDYFEFGIDGRPLSFFIKEAKDGYLGVHQFSSESNRYVKNLMLQGGSPSHSGRPIVYYLCKQCGDINCGVITVEIQETDNSIIWKKFFYESSIPEDAFEATFLRKIQNPFEFDKKQYFALLNSQIKE